MNARGLLFLSLVALGCQSFDEKLMVGRREEVAKIASDGFLPSFADAYFSGDSTLESARKPKARKAFRAECAALLAKNWETVRATELRFARNPKKSDAEWVKKNDELMVKLFTAFAEIDASLPEKWKALKEERAGIEAEAASAAAKAEAAAVKDRVLFWAEGFEDSDLETCVRSVINPLAPGQWLERRGQPAPEVLAAAATVIHLKVDMIWSEYSSREGGRVEARVPKALQLLVELDVPGKKRRSWSSNVAGENPESISGNGSNSARGVAAGLMGTQYLGLYKEACAQLAARVGK